jgi:hypothetical protein
MSRISSTRSGRTRRSGPPGRGRSRSTAAAIVAKKRDQASRLEARFGEQIEAQTRILLAERFGVDAEGNLRKKTLPTLFGKVSLTKVSERIKINVPPSQLVEWARGCCPSIIRSETKVVESVPMSDLRLLLAIETVGLGVDEETGEVRTAERVVIAGTNEPVDIASVLPVERMSIKE